jgi:hypothetical protein
MSTRINVAATFSRSPAGRFRTDGPYSGERFRDELLWPALKGSENVEVDLQGVLSCGSSFLDEAFGGLVRKYGLSSQDLERRLVVKADVKTYVQRIWKYVREAKA